MTALPLGTPPAQATNPPPMRAEVLNITPELPARWKLDIGQGKKMASAKVTILSGDSTDAYNDPAHPDRVVPEKHELALESGFVELPPHSIAIVQASV